MTCDRLKTEKARLGTEAANLGPSLFPTGGEEQRKKDLAHVDGEIVAIGKKRTRSAPGSRTASPWGSTRLAIIRRDTSTPFN